MRQHHLMPALLERIHLDGFLEQWICDPRGIGRDVEPGASLRLHRNIPDGQAGEAVARLSFELRPIQDGGTIRIVRIEQHPAEQIEMFVATKPHRSTGRPGRRGGPKAGNGGWAIHGVELLFGSALRVRSEWYRRLVFRSRRKRRNCRPSDSNRRRSERSKVIRATWRAM